ncbi:MAG: glycogen/starch/alpha-glucan phosphorylase [Lawsonibacter sp.]
MTPPCAYTNHTILAEALEKWPLSYLEDGGSPAGAHLRNWTGGSRRPTPTPGWPSSTIRTGSTWPTWTSTTASPSTAWPACTPRSWRTRS